MIGTKYNEIYDFSIRLIIDAGEKLIALKETELVVSEKVNNTDLVTSADITIDEFLCEKILNRYPDHLIISEETNNIYELTSLTGREFLWIMDPIDGTTNFLHDFPRYAISIAVYHKNSPIIGLVYNPKTKELYHAIKDNGAFLNNEPIEVSKSSVLSEAVIATGFHSDDFIPKSLVTSQIQKLLPEIRNIRIFGAASLDLCDIASGKLTGFWHKNLKPWDYAAGLLILEEAGGLATTYDCNPIDLTSESLLATNGGIHKSLQQQLFK